MGLSNQIHVLHIDDEIEFTERCGGFLEQEESEIRVTPETDPTVILERLDKGDFDCVVCDHQMPNCDGLAVLRRVRDAYPKLPFVLFSEHGPEDIAEEAISAGATDYVQKGGPESYTLLRNRITNSVDRSRCSSSEYHQMIVDSLHDAVWMIDTDGSIIYVNDSLAAATGQSQESFVGREYREVLSEQPVSAKQSAELTQIVSEILDGTRTEGRLAVTLESEGQTETRDIRMTAVTKDGETKGVMGVSRDITEQTMLQNRFEDLFEHLPDPVIVGCYEGDGIAIRDANREFERIFGIPKEKAIGHTITDLLVPDDAVEEARQLDRAIQDGELLDRVVQRRTANGSLREMRLRVVHIEGGPDSTLAYLIYEDITEREQYKQRLERQNERLNAFANMVAHDLRNPLQLAQGRLTNIEEPNRDENYEGIGYALDRIEEIIADVLELARAGEAIRETTRVALGQRVREAWRIAGAATATLVIEDDLGEIECNKRRLSALLENLFRNAIDHGGPNVTVRVGSLDNGFYIADSGPGIPLESREKVFESGYTTADAGTGFGLAIVQEVAFAHEWQLTLSEQDGGGARFEITGVTTYEKAG